jgi:hypothetical protein
MLSINDMKYLKSLTVTNTAANGGRMDERREVVGGATNNLFDRGTSAQRTAGFTALRKLFIANRNAANDPGCSGLFCSLVAPDGGDRIYITNGTQRDTVADAGYQEWVGAGTLFQSVAASATDIQAAFRATDYEIPNGATIILKNTAATAFVKTANVTATDSLGTGLSAYTQALSLTPVDRRSVSVKYTIGGTPYQAIDDGQGNITGVGITEGAVDYATGEVSITASTALDAVTVTFAQQCFTWSGNIAEIKLAEQVPNDYAVEDTNLGVCVDLTQLAPTLDNKFITSASGTFDETKITLENRGTAEDDITITFTNATAFTVSGRFEGALQTGSVNLEYAPLNPRTSRPLFTIPVAAWAGLWIAGNLVKFSTHPAASPVWIKNVIPAGTPGVSRDTDKGYLFIE